MPDCTRIYVVADLYEKTFNLRLHGNELYFTNLSIFPVKIMLCNKLLPESFQLIVFSYKITW